MGGPKDSRLGRGTLRIKGAGLFEGKKVKRRVGKEGMRNVTITASSTTNIR